MMTRPRTGTIPLLAAAILAPIAALSPTASGELMTSDEFLRIEFKVTGDWTPVDPDVLLLNFGLITVIEPFTKRIADLYDGNTLLGTASSTSFGNHVGLLNLDPSNSWKAPGSPWNFDSPGTADFTTIVDGSIDGRIEFRIATGSVDIPLNQVNLTVLRATGPNSGTVVTPVPTINSIEIIPAPGGAALLLLGAWGRRRRR